MHDWHFSIECYWIESLRRKVRRFYSIKLTESLWNLHYNIILYIKAFWQLAFLVFRCLPIDFIFSPVPRPRFSSSMTWRFVCTNPVVKLATNWASDSISSLCLTIRCWWDLWRIFIWHAHSHIREYKRYENFMLPGRYVLAPTVNGQQSSPVRQ